MKADVLSPTQPKQVVRRQADGTFFVDREESARLLADGGIAKARAALEQAFALAIDRGKEVEP